MFRRFITSSCFFIAFIAMLPFLYTRLLSAMLVCKFYPLILLLYFPVCTVILLLLLLLSVCLFYPSFILVYSYIYNFPSLPRNLIYAPWIKKKKWLICVYSNGPSLWLHSLSASLLLFLCDVCLFWDLLLFLVGDDDVCWLCFYVVGHI